MESTTQQPHVLVADDDMYMREMLRLMLEEEGLKVTTAIDGLESLKVCEEQRFDLILTDLHMPRLDGLELIAKLRRSGQYATTPIIILSSDDRAYDTNRHKDRDAFVDWFIKGTQPQDLVDNVLKRIEEARTFDLAELTAPDKQATL